MLLLLFSSLSLFLVIRVGARSLQLNTLARLVKNRIVDCSTTDGDDVENLAKKKKGVNFPSLELSLPCFATLLCQIADRSLISNFNCYQNETVVTSDLYF